MVSSILQKRFRQIVKETLGPALNSLGFQKHGQIYRRQLPELWWVVQVTRSRWNTQEEFSFDILFGIYVLGFIPRFAGRVEPERPSVPDCVIQMGLSSPAWGDWWMLRLNDDAALVDEAIKTDISNQIESIVSIFQRFQGISNVIDYFETYDTKEFWELFHRWPNKPLTTVYLGVLYWLVGDQQRSIEAFERAKAKALAADVPMFAETVDRIKERVFSQPI